MVFLLVFSGLLIAVPKIYAQGAQEEYEIPDPDKRVLKLIEEVKKANACGWKDTTLFLVRDTVINGVKTDYTTNIECQFLDATLNDIYVKITVDIRLQVVVELFLKDIKTGVEVVDAWGDTKIKKKKGDKYKGTLFGGKVFLKSMIRRALRTPFGKFMNKVGMGFITVTFLTVGTIVIVH